MALTIRLDAEEEKLIQKLQQHFNVKTASRAMLSACHAYENERKKNHSLMEKAQELEQELSRCKDIIEDFQQSFKAISNFRFKE